MNNYHRYLPIAVIAVAMAMCLSPGCFDGPNHQQYQNCNVNVNVVVDNNHVDQHVFTYLVEMVQVEDQIYSCPSGYSLNNGVCTKTTYGACTDCPYVSAVYGQWGSWQSGDCPQGEGSNTCQDEHVAPITGSWGSWSSGKCPGGDESNTCDQEKHNGNWRHRHRTYEDGYDRHHHRTYTAGYYDCHDEGYVSCGLNKEKSVNVLTTQPTCTCPVGFTKQGSDCLKVVDSETVTSTQSDPASVTLVYQFDGGWGGFFGSWCWHLKWHDRYGDHDRRFDGFDQDKTYIIRVTDTGDETGYTTETTAQTFTTSICGGDITFHYTGPSCPEGQTRCENGQCCDLQTDINNCGECGNVCPSGQTCSGGVCAPSGGGGAGPGEAGTGNDGAGPGGNVVQFLAAFTPYCDYQTTNQAPALVTFMDMSTYPHRTSAIFDFGEGYVTIDGCLSDAFNGMGTPENVSICELQQRLYAEPDPAPVNYLSYIHVKHLYANPGIYSVTLTNTWDLGNLISPPYTQTMTLTVKPGRGACTVLEPGDTYHKPFQIQIS